MPEIFPSMDATSINMTIDGHLEIQQHDPNTEDLSLIFIPKPLIPLFLKRLEEIAGGGK